MSFTGYRFYRGAGDVSNVDFTEVVATAAPGERSVEITGLGHRPATRYVYAARGVRNDLETPDVSCMVEFQTGADGGWVGNVPAAVDAVQACAGAGGSVALSWEYRTPRGRPQPADFAIYGGPSPVALSATPRATLPFTSDGRYGAVLELADAQTYFVAVTARGAGGEESPRSPIVGPLVARAAPPPQPVAYVRTTF